MRFVGFFLIVLSVLRSDLYFDAPMPPVSSGYQLDRIGNWSNNGLVDCQYYDPMSVIRTDNNQTTIGYYADPCLPDDCTDATSFFEFFSISLIDDPTAYNTAYHIGQQDITLNDLSPLKCQVYTNQLDVVAVHDRNITCDPSSTIDVDNNGYCVCRDGYVPSYTSTTSCDPIPADRTKDNCRNLQSQAISEVQQAVYDSLPADYNATNSRLIYFAPISMDVSACTENSALNYGLATGKLDQNSSTIDALAVSYVECARICQVAAMVRYPDTGGGTTGGTGDTGGGTTGGTGDTGGGTTGGTGDTGGSTGDTGGDSSGGSTGGTTGDTNTTGGGTGDGTNIDLTETNNLLRDILNTNGESEAQNSMSYLDNMGQFLNDLSTSVDNVENAYTDFVNSLDGTYVSTFTTSSNCTIVFSVFGANIPVNLCKWSYIVRPWVVFITTLFLLYYLIVLHLFFISKLKK